MNTPTGAAPAPTKSERTRARILACAKTLFGADGFERTTIRAVAAAADIDPSMVMRYFGSKESLFAEAADFDLQLRTLGPLSPRHAGATLVAHFMARWEGHPELQILLRAASSNPTVAHKMRGIFAQQLKPVVVALSPVDTAPLRAALLSSQMLGFAFSRYVLQLPDLVRLSASDVVALLGPTIQRYLVGDLDLPVATVSTKPVAKKTVRRASMVSGASTRRG